MPTYRFVVEEDGRKIPLEEPFELAAGQDAEREAVQTLASMMCDAVRHGAMPTRLAVTVVAEVDEQAVLTASLALTVDRR